MKNKFYTLALTGIVAASSLMPAAAFASDGRITISGELTGETCKVNGGTGGDLVVTLDPTGTTALAKVGETAARKPFRITLSDCPGTGTVKAGFEPGENTDLVSGRLNLIHSSSTATNVQLELRNGDDSVIKIGDSSTIKGVDIDNKGAVLDYKVGYYATGAATSGTVNTTVFYSIIYL